MKPTEKRCSLITPSIYFAKIFLDPVASISIVICLAIALYLLKNQRKSILKGVGFGTITIFAFVGAVFTFGYLGYSTPIFAIIGAWLLPLMIPVAISVTVFEGLRGVMDIRKTSN